MTPEKIAETAKRIRDRIFDRVQDEGAFHASSIERVISDELRLAMVANVPAAVAHYEPIDVYTTRQWLTLVGSGGFVAGGHT